MTQNPRSIRRVPAPGMVLRCKGFGSLKGENPKIAVAHLARDSRQLEGGDSPSTVKAGDVVGFVAIDHCGSEIRFNWSHVSACWVAMVGIGGGYRWA